MKTSAFFFLLLISVIDQASAAVVTYTQDRRYVHNTVCCQLTSNNYYYPSAPYADWNITNGITTTYQNSSLGGDALSAVGTGTGIQQTVTVQWTSVFDITLSVANDTTVTLSGTLSANDYGNAALALYQGDTTSTQYQLYRNSVQSPGAGLGQSATISYSRVLNPGEYRLRADTGATVLFHPYSNFNFTASFTPVPVPGAAWLFGSGLIGLIGMCSKRRRC